ncbi:MAG: choline dehydrogenase [Cocleimonas sp.]
MAKQEFDYIIVGAGSAGCVLANRLSADATKTVCLIEAGPEDKSFLIRMPAGVVGLLWDSRHNWKYYSEPEPAMHNRRMYCPRGKVLGGSSAINAMVFTRGVPDDFDAWEALGNKGWGWNDLLPHFKATQKQLRPGMDTNYHGYEGEQLVADPENADPMSHDFVKAVEESGVASYSDDLNGEQQEGASLYQTYQTGTGKRCSAAHAFIDPIRSRDNLTIVTKALVEKVIFKGEKAIGVQLGLKGKQQQILANKEVILSAGAINSPQLLMLSGIGNTDEITTHGVESVHNLPGVGKNLQDHIDVVVNTRVIGYQGLGISLPYIIKTPLLLFKYLSKGKGHLASNGAEGGAFIKSSPDLKNPDIQIHFGPLLLESHFIRTIGHGHAMHLCNLRPKSRGSITLKTNNPKDKPAILFNYCQEPDDIKVLVKAVKIARKILAAPSLFQHQKKLYQPSTEIQTDEQIEEWVREKGETIYHPVGTCKMGSDPMAVVDQTLKVHGVKNLRVVDASIMPLINAGNTHASVIAIANKAAELIISEANNTLEKN